MSQIHKALLLAAAMISIVPEKMAQLGLLAPIALFRSTTMSPGTCKARGA